MQQFLYDWRKLVSDLLIDSHYVTGREIARILGATRCQPGGSRRSGLSTRWTEMPRRRYPRGEFWIRHRGIFLVKEIASAARL